MSKTVKTGKRIFAFLLAAIMTVMLVPGHVFADVVDSIGSVDEGAVVDYLHNESLLQPLSAPGTFNVQDIAAINNIITTNGLPWPLAPEDGSYVPARWGLTTGSHVRWTAGDADGLDRRIYTKVMSWSTLRGTIDFTGLTYLTRVNVNQNQLTAIDISGLQHLNSIEIGNNRNLSTVHHTGLHPQLAYLSIWNGAFTEFDLSGVVGPHGNGPTTFRGQGQLVNLTLERVGPGEFALAIPLNNPIFGNPGITYENGILISNSNTITSTTFTIQTGSPNAAHVLTGTMNFTYVSPPVCDVCDELESECVCEYCDTCDELIYPNDECVCEFCEFCFELVYPYDECICTFCTICLEEEVDCVCEHCDICDKLTYPRDECVCVYCTECGELLYPVDECTCACCYDYPDCFCAPPPPVVWQYHWPVGGQVNPPIIYAPGLVVPDESGIIQWQTDFQVDWYRETTSWNSQLTIALAPQGFTGLPPTWWVGGAPTANSAPVSFHYHAGTGAWQVMNENAQVVPLWSSYRMQVGVAYRIYVMVDTFNQEYEIELWLDGTRLRNATIEMNPTWRYRFEQGLLSVSVNMQGANGPIYTLTNYTQTWPGRAVVVDKTELIALINYAEGLDENDWTARSWEVLLQALAAAITVRDNANASGRDVFTAVNNLQAAIDGLVCSLAPCEECGYYPDDCICCEYCLMLACECIFCDVCGYSVYPVDNCTCPMPLFVGNWVHDERNHIFGGSWTHHELRYATGAITPNAQGIIRWGTDLTLNTRAFTDVYFSFWTRYMAMSGGGALGVLPTIRAGHSQGYAATCGSPIVFWINSGGRWVIFDEQERRVDMWENYQMELGAAYRLTLTINVETYEVLYQLLRDGVVVREATHIMRGNATNKRGMLKYGIASATIGMFGGGVGVGFISNFTRAFGGDYVIPVCDACELYRVHCICNFCGDCGQQIDISRAMNFRCGCPPRLGTGDVPPCCDDPGCGHVVLTVGPGRQFATIQAAHDAAQPGSVIMIDAAGVYFGADAFLDITTPNIRLVGFNGRPVMEMPYQDFFFEDWRDPTSRHQQTRNLMGTRVGIWIVGASDVVIENIEFFGAINTNTVNPGAGISVANNVGGTLTIRDVHIHRCEVAFRANMNFGLDLIIERSEFGFNGERRQATMFASNVALRVRTAEITHSFIHSFRASENINPLMRTGTHMIAARVDELFVMRYSRLGDYTPCTYLEKHGHARGIRFYEQPDIYLIGNVFYSKFGSRGSPNGHSGSGTRPIEIGDGNAAAHAAGRSLGRRLFVVNNTFMSDNVMENVPIELRNQLIGQPGVEPLQILVVNNIFSRAPGTLALGAHLPAQARFVGYNFFTGEPSISRAPGQHYPDIFVDRFYGRDPRIADTPDAREHIIGRGVNPNEIAAAHGFTHAIDICLIPRYVFNPEIGATTRRPMTGGRIDIGAFQFVDGPVDCETCYDFGCIECHPELYCLYCEQLLDDCICCDLCDNQGCIECQPHLFCEECELLLDDCVCIDCKLCDDEGCIACQPELFCADCEELLDDCTCYVPRQPLIVSGNNAMFRINYAPGDVMPDNNGIIEWRTDLTLTQRAGGPAANADSRISLSMTPQGYVGRPDPHWYSHNDSPIQIRTTTIGNNWQVRTTEQHSSEWGYFYISYLWDNFRMTQGVTYELVIKIDVETFYVTYQLWEGNVLHREGTFEMSTHSGNPGATIPNNNRELFVNGLANVYIRISHNTNAIPSIFTLENYTLVWPDGPQRPDCPNEAINYDGLYSSLPCFNVPPTPLALFDRNPTSWFAAHLGNWSNVQPPARESDGFEIIVPFDFSYDFGGVDITFRSRVGDTMYFDFNVFVSEDGENWSRAILAASNQYEPFTSTSPQFPGIVGYRATGSGAGPGASPFEPTRVRFAQPMEGSYVKLVLYSVFEPTAAPAYRVVGQVIDLWFVLFSDACPDCDYPVDDCVCVRWDVTFDINFPSGTNPATQTVFDGDYLTLPAVTRPSHIFNGWFTAPVDGYLVGLAGATFTPETNVTLYAQWTVSNVIFVPIAGRNTRHVLYYFRDLQDGQSIVFEQRNGQDTVRAYRENGQTVIHVWPAATHNAAESEIAIAFYALRPGDTLYFHEGQYGRLPWVWTRTSSHNASLAAINNPTMSGTPGNPITISGYPGGARPRIFDTGSGPLLWTTGSHLNITYLEFGKTNGSWQHMLRVGGISNHVMSNVEITHIHFIGTITTQTQTWSYGGNSGSVTAPVGAGQALAINAGGSNNDLEDILVAYNVFRNTRATKIYIGEHRGGTRGRNIVVRDNFLCGAGMLRPNYDGQSNFGMQLKQGITGIVENNLWINTRGPAIMVHGTSEANMRNAAHGDWVQYETIVRNNIVVGMGNHLGCFWQHYPRRSQWSAPDPVWYYYDWFWYEGTGIYVGGGITSVYNNIALDSGSAGIKIESFFIRRPGDLYVGARPGQQPGPEDNLFNNIDVRNNTTGHNSSPFRDFADYSQDVYLPGTGYATRWDDTAVRRRTNNTTQADLYIFVEDNIYHCSTETSDLLAEMIEQIKALRAMPATAGTFFAAIEANPGPYTESELINKLAILLGITDLVTVDFDINFTGGANPASITVEEGTQVMLPIITECPGFAFLGWYTTRDTGGVRRGGSGDYFTPTVSETLYARWLSLAPSPVFGWSIFNNGPGGTQYPRPNAGLAASGIIRMWTQLDGINAPVYLAAADTIVATDQDGNPADNFVRVGRVWVAGQGWADYFNLLDVNKNGDWQYINLYITVYSQTVHVLLVNALFEVTPPPVFSWSIFNNGPGGTQYPRPNAGLAASGTIRIWTQLDGINAPVYLAAADTISARDQDDECAMDFVRVGRVWVAGQGWADYFNLLDVNKNGDWQYINLYITVYGQTVHVLLVNALFEAVEPPVFDCDYCEDEGCEVCEPTQAVFYLAVNAVVLSNTNRHVSVFFGGTAEGPVTLNLIDDAPELILQVRNNLWTPTGLAEGIVVGVAGNSTIIEARTVTLEVTRQGITVTLEIDLTI